LCGELYRRFVIIFFIVTSSIAVVDDSGIVSNMMNKKMKAGIVLISDFGVLLMYDMTESFI